jgi:hypothetical protein
MKVEIEGCSETLVFAPKLKRFEGKAEISDEYAFLFRECRYRYNYIDFIFYPVSLLFNTA